MVASEPDVADEIAALGFGDDGRPLTAAGLTGAAPQATVDEPRAA
jgi:hypothetical protein